MQLVLIAATLAVHGLHYTAAIPVGTHESANGRLSMIVVVGAEGEEEYGRMFRTWADRWIDAAKRSDATCSIVGLDPPDGNDRDALIRLIQAESREGPSELWVVLIGHGTFDGRTSRINLRGPDLSESELARLLAPITRPTVVVNCAAASGPFLNKLSASHRVVITATRSGNEQNFARFGDYLSQAITDRNADFDKDGQTSLLEAYLAASRQVAEFYRTEARLATEHALLDDNGDGLGTPADWFRGIRAVKRAADGAESDGYRSHQFVLLRSKHEQAIPAALRQQRDELELAVARLRDRKHEMPEALYYRQLEEILVQLARIHQQVEQIKSEQAKPAEPH